MTNSIVLRDAKAPSVAVALDERVFCYFGLSEIIHTDQGDQFELALMNNLYGFWGVPHNHTTPYHPQDNEVVERGNRALGIHCTLCF